MFGLACANLFNLMKNYNYRQEAEMKKYILSLLVIAIVCVAGCGLKAHNNDSHYINAEQEGNDSEKMLYEILQCFNDKDADRLKGMFAPDIKDKYDIDGQINYAFKMYNGESVYDGEVRNGGIASSTIKDGIYIEKTVDAVLNGIKTDQEETFRITIIRRVVDDAVPQAVGLEKIYLQDGDYKAKAVIGKTYRGEETDIRQQNQTVSDDVDDTASIVIRNGKTNEAHVIQNDEESIGKIEQMLQGMSMIPCSEESYDEWDYKYTLSNRKNQFKVMYIFRDGHCCVNDKDNNNTYYKIDDTSTYNELIEFAKSLVD